MLSDVLTETCLSGSRKNAGSEKNIEAEFRAFTNATQGNGTFNPQGIATAGFGGAAVNVNFMGFFVAGSVINYNRGGDAVPIAVNHHSPELVNEA
ncbi:hypothetical protein J9303_08430 [Bacillaceae bacterium Marseille-Q3522]|nr:hypothetical protein [Bacillaceae bacterium Marseille-Q3522]